MATVRIDEETHEKLKSISSEDDVSITDLIACAVESLERNRFWKQYAQQLADRTPEEIAEDQEELEAWDGTLMDGLENEPWSAGDCTEGLVR